MKRILSIGLALFFLSCCKKQDNQSEEGIFIDSIAPVAKCQDISINLDDEGKAVITPAMINNGSSDNHIRQTNLILSLDKTTFNSTSIGANKVTLTVIDSSGNHSSCDATVSVSLAVAPAENDPRVAAWVDAYKAFTSYPWSRYSRQLGRDQAGKNIQDDLRNMAEPGYLDWIKNEYSLVKAANPADPSKMVFKHKLIKGMSYRDDGTYLSGRAQILSSWSVNSPAVTHDGKPFWAVSSFYFDTDWPNISGGPAIGLGSFGHSVSSQNTQSLHQFQMTSSRTLRFWISSNTILDAPTNSAKITTAFNESVTAGHWYYFLIQSKFEWDVANNPWTRIWMATDNEAPRLIYSSTIANSNRESAGYHPWKFGLYMWDTDNSWGTSDTRTYYSKGIFIFNDVAGTPTLDVNSLIKLIRSM